MGIKQEVLDELNAWSAQQRQERAAQAAAVEQPTGPATPADIRAALIAYSSEDLERFAAVPVAMLDWGQLSAEQRRALAAADVLAERRRKAQREGDRAAQAFERTAVAARTAREEQARSELQPLADR